MKKNIQNEEKFLIDKYSKLERLDIIKNFQNNKEKENEFISKFLVNKQAITNDEKRAGDDYTSDHML